jgi:hypothetical protein
MARFRDIKTLQKFDSAHASIHNHFDLERHLVARDDFKNTRRIKAPSLRIASHWKGRAKNPWRSPYQRRGSI